VSFGSDPPSSTGIFRIKYEEKLVPGDSILDVWSPDRLPNHVWCFVSDKYAHRAQCIGLGSGHCDKEMVNRSATIDDGMTQFSVKS
jgi:hypothetical protein